MTESETPEQYLENRPICGIVSKTDALKAVAMAKQNVFCKTCGFPKDMERDPVFLDDNVFSIIHYEENKCEECGHQKDGFTIKKFKPYISELVKKVCEREREKLIHEEQKFVCDIKKREIISEFFEEIENKIGGYEGQIDVCIENHVSQGNIEIIKWKIETLEEFLKEFKEKRVKK